MRRIFNQLIQLQELHFALAEQSAADPRAHLDQLRQVIDKLCTELPPEIAGRYLALQKRFPLAVVPVSHGGCSGCGLSVPVATINDLRAATRIHPCPHCGRFLYVQEIVAHPPQKARPKGPPRNGIARFSANELMVPRLAAKTRDEAIAELARVMVAGGFAEDADTLTKLALSREAMLSTAVDHGLAFPHVRNIDGGSLTLALGLKPGGIKFGAPDDHLSKIIFFIIIPAPASAFYLKLLAGLVRTLSETEARRKLLDCETPEDVWKTLTALTRETIP